MSLFSIAAEQVSTTRLTVGARPPRPEFAPETPEARAYQTQVWEAVCRLQALFATADAEAPVVPEHLVYYIVELCIAMSERGMKDTPLYAALKELAARRADCPLASLELILDQMWEQTQLFATPYAAAHRLKAEQRGQGSVVLRSAKRSRDAEEEGDAPPSKRQRVDAPPSVEPMVLDEPVFEAPMFAPAEQAMLLGKDTPLQVLVTGAPKAPAVLKSPPPPLQARPDVARLPTRAQPGPKSKGPVNPVVKAALRPCGPSAPTSSVSTMAVLAAPVPSAEPVATVASLPAQERRRKRKHRRVHVTTNDSVTKMPNPSVAAAPAPCAPFGSLFVVPPWTPRPYTKQASIAYASMAIDGLRVRVEPCAYVPGLDEPDNGTYFVYVPDMDNHEVRHKVSWYDKHDKALTLPSKHLGNMARGYVIVLLDTVRPQEMTLETAYHAVDLFLRPMSLVYAQCASAFYQLKNRSLHAPSLAAVTAMAFLVANFDFMKREPIGTGNVKRYWYSARDMEEQEAKALVTAKRNERKRHEKRPEAKDPVPSAAGLVAAE